MMCYVAPGAMSECYAWIYVLWPSDAVYVSLFNYEYVLSRLVVAQLFVESSYVYKLH
jgi:hypothetical protein